MKPSPFRALLALSSLLAVVALLATPERTRAAYKQAIPQQQTPNPVTDSLQLVIQDCTDQHLPLPNSAVGLDHRRNGVLIASWARMADAQAKVKFVIPNLLPGDSAYVSLHPPGLDPRDYNHRYRYFGQPSQPAASSVGVWDLSASIVVGCFDEKAFLPEETILCRYRPTIE